MLQQINLYKKSPEVKQAPLSFLKILQINLSFLGLLFLFSGYLIYNRHSESANLEKLKQEKEKLDQGLDQVKTTVPTEADRSKLMSEIEKLEKIRSQRERMFATLGRLQYEKKIGFSKYFESLSEQAISGLWFTKFDIYSGGSLLYLEGDTQDAEHVPKLIQALGNSEPFADKTFESLKIYKKTNKEVVEGVELKDAEYIWDVDEENSVIHFVIKSET